MSLTSYVSDKATDVTEYVSDKFTDTTEYVSNKVDETTEYVSDKVTKTTEDMSRGIDEASRTASKGIEALTDVAQTLSPMHNLVQVFTNEEEMDNPDAKIANDRFAKFGDPAAKIKEKSEEPENPYDYPKALRKYL